MENSKQDEKHDPKEVVEDGEDDPGILLAFPCSMGKLGRQLPKYYDRDNEAVIERNRRRPGVPSVLIGQLLAEDYIHTMTEL